MREYMGKFLNVTTKPKAETQGEQVCVPGVGLRV